ncbi:hypothetical protein [Streptomyces sp. NPDC058545]|uniref:hypothetical protein n=1 Tax=Streptomyces sp. NPDC058545 TaxID=3346544 RepID=UPI00366083F2
MAVEHIAKACLASVALSLLAPIKPLVDDLLVLGGQEDRAVKGRAGLKSIGGEEAVKRAGEVLENRQLPDHLNALREACNSTTHMGRGRPSSECRALVASAGISTLRQTLHSGTAQRNTGAPKRNSGPLEEFRALKVVKGSAARVHNFGSFLRR